MNLIKSKINLEFLVEGRGVKTYFEKLLRSFPAKRSGVASPGLLRGATLGAPRSSQDGWHRSLFQGPQAVPAWDPRGFPWVVFCS